MARTYSEKFITELYGDITPNLGRDLGRACVEARLPVDCVANPLQVSKLSIHNWFRGRPIRKSREDSIRHFMTCLARDTQLGLLPAQNPAMAHKYAETLMAEFGVAVPVQLVPKPEDREYVAEIVTTEAYDPIPSAEDLEPLDERIVL